MSISDQDLDRLEAQALASSKPPMSPAVVDRRYKPVDWLLECVAQGGPEVHAVARPESDPARVVCVTGNGPHSKANAEFFSVAREAVLALVAEVRRLKRE